MMHRLDEKVIYSDSPVQVPFHVASSHRRRSRPPARGGGGQAADTLLCDLKEKQKKVERFRASQNALMQCYKCVVSFPK